MFTYNLSIFLTSTAFVSTNAKYGIPLSRYTVFLQNCPLGYNPISSAFLYCLYVSNQGVSILIADNSNVRVQAKKSCGASGCNIAVEHCLYSLCLSLSVCKKNYLASLEHALDTHCKRVLRNVVLGCKKSCVSSDRVGSESCKVSISQKLAVRLIEPDVTVSSYSKNLYGAQQ